MLVRSWSLGRQLRRVVKRTLEIYECDVCGKEAVRYSVNFPDGTLTLDRCSQHDSKVQKLRDEKGAWTTKSGAGRSSFKVSSVEDIQKQVVT